MDDKKIREINERIEKKLASGESHTIKMIHPGMSTTQKFRFNLCVKINELLSHFNIDEIHLTSVSKEDIRRIEHRHYDYFETDRLLIICNEVIFACGVSSSEVDDQVMAIDKKQAG